MAAGSSAIVEAAWLPVGLPQLIVEHGAVVGGATIRCTRFISTVACAASASAAIPAVSASAAA